MENQLVITYNYDDVPTVEAFVNSDKYISAIMGPVGSGKSVGCVMYLINKMCKQAPDENGVRRTRFVIIRNTFAQLNDTTKKTIDRWMRFGRWYEAKHEYHIDIDLADGTSVQSEWLLRALDRPDQVAQLLSLELTGGWMNEAKELPKEVFDTLQFRVGRYPEKSDDGKYKPTWHGVCMDTNPPDEDHWFYKHFEIYKPDNSVLFKQPSGLSKEAENLSHLPDNYYTNGMRGKDKDFIRVYVEGQYGYLRTGKPIFSNFSIERHLSKEPLLALRGGHLIIGLDFGLTPAAVITQMDARGRLLILDELQADCMSIREFLNTMLKPMLRTKYPYHEHLIIGDPAGAQRSQVDSRTVYQEIRTHGLKAKPARSNAINARIAAVNSFLTKTIENKPGFLLDPGCTALKVALAHGYRFRRMKVSDERYTDVPDKNEHSHIADALQYACLEHELGFVGYDPLSLDQELANAKPLSSAAWT